MDPTLFDPPPPPPAAPTTSPRPTRLTLPTFDGATFSPTRDHGRLTLQLTRVERAMRDGEWRSLGEIAAMVSEPPASVASVSARLRDLRKAKFGGHSVQRRRRSGGLWEYRVVMASVV